MTIAKTTTPASKVSTPAPTSAHYPPLKVLTVDGSNDNDDDDDDIFPPSVIKNPTDSIVDRSLFGRKFHYSILSTSKEAQSKKKNVSKKYFLVY